LDCLCKYFKVKLIGDMNLSGASNYYFLKQFLGDHYELGYIDAWKIMSHES